MTSAPGSPKPKRTPWIVAGVLGCVVVCLAVAIVGAGYFFLGPQLAPVAKVLPTLTRVPFGLSTPTNPIPFPTGQLPTSQPTVMPTLFVTPTTQLPTASSVAVVPPSATKTLVPPTLASPKGKIAFSKSEGDRPEDKYIWVMNVDGTGAKKIIDRASGPTFSPDGTKIAYYHWADGIFVANADGTNPQKIVGETNVGFIEWSHDGRWVAFSTQPSGGTNILIDIVPPDPNLSKTPGARRNVSIGESPSWSPDDTQIVFHTCRGTTCGIYKASVGGGDAIPLAGDDGGLPAWSPDGKRIVYQKEVDGQKQLFVIGADGSGKKQLTSGAYMHVDAEWSSDGNYIFYRSTQGGTWGIYRMNSDGTNPIKLMDNAVPVTWPYERLAISK